MNDIESYSNKDFDTYCVNNMHNVITLNHFLLSKIILKFRVISEFYSPRQINFPPHVTRLPISLISAVSQTMTNMTMSSSLNLYLGPEFMYFSLEELFFNLDGPSASIIFKVEGTIPTFIGEVKLLKFE